MAIHIGASGKAKVRPEMNVTPLVDVVLVLLIIFMVITPLLSKQFWVNVPEMEKAEQSPELSDPNVPVVLGIGAGGTLTINRRPVAASQLDERLRRIMAARPDPKDKVLFVDADDEAPLGAAVDAMDTARGAGVVTIAVIPEKGTG
jgi:biopolymer transport protein TolR